MNQLELTVTKQALRKQLALYEDLVPCCQSCDHYALRECLKFKAPPPDDWIKQPNQCEHWKYDFIPF